MNFETYFMRVLTPMHVGAGEGLRYIDLPIEREAHTDFPLVQSTAIKGAIRTIEILKIAKKLDEEEERELRDFAEDQLDLKDVDELGRATLIERLLENIKDDKLQNAPNSIKSILNDISNLANKLGKKNKEGNLAFVDARILFFPVKSLRGIFALVTCPYVLERFRKDTDVNISLPEVPKSASECIVIEDSVITVSNKLVLEEFALTAKTAKTGNIQIEDQSLSSMIDMIDMIDLKRVAVVHDDLFSHIVKNYTEVQTHIKVDIEMGTVEGGALWTEEYVPAEAIFYFKVVSNNGSFITIPNILQIGGNSSTGKGIVEVIKHAKS